MNHSLSTRLFRPTSLLVRRTAVTPRRFFHPTPAAMVVHEINSLEEFNTAIKQHNKVVLDCYAAWCGPCKVISPILERFSNEALNNSVYFIKVDVDKVPDLSEELGIRAMPTFVFYKDGEKADELVGAAPQVLDQKLKALQV